MRAIALTIAAGAVELLCEPLRRGETHRRAVGAARQVIDLPEAASSAIAVCARGLSAPSAGGVQMRAKIVGRAHEARTAGVAGARRGSRSRCLRGFRARVRFGGWHDGRLSQAERASSRLSARAMSIIGAYAYRLLACA